MEHLLSNHSEVVGKIDPESITVSKPVRLKETDNSTGLIFYPTGVKIRFYAYVKHKRV